MSGIIGSEQFNREFPATLSKGPDDVHTGTIQGTVTSCYELGCFFGALFAYFTGEMMGRRRMMLLGATVMVIGTLITVTAFGPGARDHKGNVGGFVQFFIGRVITGLGNGANTATVPTWVAETSKAHNRGFLICLEGSAVAVGTVIAYWIDFGISYVDTSVSWRFPISLQILFALLLIAGVLVLPESPRWLIMHNYNAEAQHVVSALRGDDIFEPEAVAEKNRLVETIQAQTAAEASKKDILKQGKNQHLTRALVGASTQLFQQIGGCNAVIYYSTLLFQNQIGLEHRLSLILGGVLSIVYMIFALLSFVLVEKVGRRKLFFIGTWGQAISMFITWGCLLPKNNVNAAKGAAFGLYFFIAFFGATWLPLPWLYPAELNSMAVRTQANAVSTMTNWLSNFLVVQVLPTMTASIGGWTFFLFAIANLIFLPFIFFFYPETGGRSLEELDVVYAHAHLTHQRTTKVASSLPKLSDAQVQVMSEKYDIHGETSHDEEAGHIDTTIPSDSEAKRAVSPSPAGTRVGSHEDINSKKESQ